MPPQKMTFMRGSLYPRVSILVRMFSGWANRIFRCDSDGKRMVRYLPYSFLLILNLLQLEGRSFMTQACTQNRMLSNQNGSSTRTEACAKIRCWHQYLDLENGSAPGDTWPTPCFLLLLPLFSRFSTSRRAATLMEGLILCIHIQAAP